MNQKEFTDTVVQRFLILFPQLKHYTLELFKDVSYLELSSSGGKLKILICTRDNMLTYGFAAGIGVFDWHDHFTSHEFLDQDVENIAGWITIIINNEVGILYSSVLGYRPVYEVDFEEIEKYREKDEIIELKYWSDL